MPPIKWITWKEKVVGRNSPKYTDVDNRPLRQIVEIQGWDPDDVNFTGLHHFPVGLYTDDIHQQTALGVNIHDDVTFVSGKHTINADDDFAINLGTNDLLVDNGNIRLTNGRFFGDIDIGVIATSLTIGNDVGDIPILNGLLDVAEHGTFTCRSLNDADIRFLNLLTEAVNYAPGRVWTEHKIGGHRYLSFDPTAAAEVLIWWTDSKKHQWTKGVGKQLEIDGYAAGDGLISAWVITEFHDLLKLFYDLAGGRTLKYDAIGSGGAGKRNVYVDD